MTTDLESLLVQHITLLCVLALDVLLQINGRAEKVLESRNIWQKSTEQLPFFQSLMVLPSI